MAARTTTPQLHHSLPACGVCGCSDVDLDYVDAGQGAELYALELGECPRCDHRWTRPLRVPTRRELQAAAVVRSLQQPAEAIPNAA